MRVLFVISGLGLGGAERQVVTLAKELARRGNAVSIYTLSRETPRMDELAGSDVEVLTDEKRRKLDPGVLARLRRHIVGWRADVVHGFLYDGNLYARLAAAGTRARVLNSERSDNYDMPLRKRIALWLTRPLCEGVVANSHSGARFARRLHRMAPERVHVVWNGIDLQEIDARLARSTGPAREIAPGPGLKRLCMVGSIHPGKDQLLALRVLRCLVDKDPSWRLVFAGEAKPEHQAYKAQLRAECARLGLEGFVHFVGNRRDVPELMASSDLLLVTSRNEGFPNVVLEAMACGTAVVTTDYSDVRRIVPFTAQVVGSRDERDLAAAVRDCHSRRAEIARVQRRWVETHATAAASASTLLEVYARTVETMKPLRVMQEKASSLALVAGHIRGLGDSLDILEAGCGRQWPLRLEGMELRLTGIDTDAAALGARRDLQRAIVGDLRNGALLPRASCDVIYNSFVLEHVDGAERVLENFLSWLRPGGLLVLRVPDRHSVYGFLARVTPFRLHVLYKRVIERLPNAGKPGFDPYPTHYDPVVSREGIHAFCRRHRCRIVEEYGTGFYMRGRLGGVKRIVAQVLSALTFGRLAWRHNNLTFVIERGAAVQAAVRKAA